MFIINNNSSIPSPKKKKVLSSQFFWYGGETDKIQSKKVKFPENIRFLPQRGGYGNILPVLTCLTFRNNIILSWLTAEANSNKIAALKYLLVKRNLSAIKASANLKVMFVRWRGGQPKLFLEALRKEGEVPLLNSSRSRATPAKNFTFCVEEDHCPCFGQILFLSEFCFC